MTIPSPCGLAITSVTSDNQYLYALQPDRKTVYKLDVCGRIICVFKLTRKYTSVYYCGGRFYATTSCNPERIYILNKCFNETGYTDIEFPCEPVCADSCTKSCGCTENTLFVGPAGDCSNTCRCMLSVANSKNSYLADRNGRLFKSLSAAGKNKKYTAIGENDGILFEGLESTSTSSTFIRATLLSSGQTKLMRLPFGYKVKGFFCYGGRLYAFITKNSFHAYVAAICVYLSDGILCGEILSLPDSSDSESCFDESCGCTRCNGSSCSSNTCGCVSSNQSDFCDNLVSGDSTDTDDCDVEELCRLFNCIKKLCKNNSNSCQNCGSCSCQNDNNCQNGCGNTCGCTSCGNTCGCCDGGTLSCTCFPQCSCTESDADSDNCLPLPVCPDNVCCPRCTQTQSTACPCGDLKISFSASK